MYYPLYNNPFYYPTGAYIPNMCSCSYAYKHYNNSTVCNENISPDKAENRNTTNNENFDLNKGVINNDFFSINGDRLEVFGISINIDDLIILIMLFFLFKESQIDYSIIIILALILFDQS